MKPCFLLRGFAAPSIISVYTMIGIKNALNLKELSIRSLMAGGVLGFSYGTYYVITGNSLNEFIYRKDV